MCDQRTLFIQLCVWIPLLQRFPTAFFDDDAYGRIRCEPSPSGLYSACCYPLVIKYLSHFPRLFILEIHFRSVSIPSDSVRQFGCLPCFQNDYLHNLPDSLLFRHTFRKGYFCIKIKFDTDMYGTFEVSVVRSILRSKIIKKLTVRSV